MFTKHRTIIVILMLCFGLLAAPPASAHTDNSEGFSKVSGEPGKLRYHLMLDYFELGRVVMLEAMPDMPATELARKLEENRAAILTYIQDNLKVYINGQPVDGALVQSWVDTRIGRLYANLVLDYPNASNSNAVEISYGIFFDDNDELHRNITSYELNGREGQYVFSALNRGLPLGETWYIGQAMRFIQLGFHHIMIGLDHILFVVALVLTSKSVRDVLKTVTIFTLAHSVTLGLTALNIISVPSETVEPLIALSIAYVAIETCIMRQNKARPYIVFGFGLMHGVGFAGALELTGPLKASSLLSLGAFNIGVELGQLLVIGLLFVPLLLVRRYNWARRVEAVAMVSVFALGFFWYWERMLA
ncbi:HupE/UreJ family protein [Paenibacillus xerothermodurans]|uniref:HupE/UreJ family protein n=1 Tax=Paenibacillus xerothermodurans TaxID=1977292 RepID=A0A2W1NBP6_PAEXE|nr:HupE/UreJ family protein [Paenibacillus xerothermodurans]PZE20521.1 HupE/UreJ family protein [Paenibacillus xerothermodurans]